MSYIKNSFPAKFASLIFAILIFRFSRKYEQKLDNFFLYKKARGLYKWDSRHLGKMDGSISVPQTVFQQSIITRSKNSKNTLKRAIYKRQISDIENRGTDTQVAFYFEKKKVIRFLRVWGRFTVVREKKNKWLKLIPQCV